MAGVGSSGMQAGNAPPKMLRGPRTEKPRSTAIHSHMKSNFSVKVVRSGPSVRDVSKGKPALQLFLRFSNEPKIRIVVLLSTYQVVLVQSTLIFLLLLL